MQRLGKGSSLCKRELENLRQPHKTRFFIKEAGASLLRERAARCAQTTPSRALSMEADAVLRLKASSGLIASIFSPFPSGKPTPALRNGGEWGEKRSSKPAEGWEGEGNHHSKALQNHSTPVKCRSVLPRAHGTSHLESYFCTSVTNPRSSEHPASLRAT